jgi:hypothetical protein
MGDPVGLQLLIVEGQLHPVAETNSLSSKIIRRSRAIEAQPATSISIIEIGVDQRFIHGRVPDVADAHVDGSRRFVVL